MKFRHAYVVGEVKEEEITLLDPHGDVKSEQEQFYAPALKGKMEKLNVLLEQLEKEMKEHDYGSFSSKLMQKLDKIFDDLKEQKKGKTALLTLSKKWNYLKNRKELIEKDGKLTGLRNKVGKNVITKLMENKELLAKEDIGKGFLSNKVIIKGEQFVTYVTLMNNFESIRINKIK